MEEITNFLNSNYFINKTILSVSRNKKVLYLCPKTAKNKNDKVKTFKIKNCNKIIGKLDTILIDLDCHNEKEFKTLKCIMEALVNENLNPKIEIIMIKNSDSNVSVYQDLISRFWEGLIKFKGMFSQTPNIKYINLNS